MPEPAIDITKVTLKQLVDSRPDLITAVEAREHEGTVTVSVEKDAQGRVVRWTEERRGLEDELFGKRVDESSYYETGEIDTITQSVYDGEELFSKKQVKHFKDARRPEVMAL